MLFTRVIHGAHMKGRNVGYWKPSERKTGDLWVDVFTNPKTKQVQPYTVYGGKLAGTADPVVVPGGVLQQPALGAHLV